MEKLGLHTPGTRFHNVWDAWGYRHYWHKHPAMMDDFGNLFWVDTRKVLDFIAGEAE
jgi:hypothetical protein